MMKLYLQGRIFPAYKFVACMSSLYSLSFFKVLLPKSFKCVRVQCSQYWDNFEYIYIQYILHTYKPP